MPSQAAYTPFKESLILAPYQATREALYTLRDSVAVAVKNGYKAPTAHMAEINGMLQFHEEQRQKLRDRKPPVRGKGKAQVRSFASSFLRLISRSSFLLAVSRRASCSSLRF